jgi:nucleotide-binding universal stress UspA family protein
MRDDGSPARSPACGHVQQRRRRCEGARGRDAVCLARALTSANPNLTLAHVQVVAPKPALDSGAAGAAARRRDALERLAALRDESRLDAEVVCGEAREVRRGLHDIARTREVDLLVISASRQGAIYGDLVGNDARDLLDNPRCTVAEAPVGYSVRPVSVQATASPTVARQEAIASSPWRGRSPPTATPGSRRSMPYPTFMRAILGTSRPAMMKWPRRGIGSGSWASRRTPSMATRSQQLGRFGRSVDLVVLGSHSHGPIGLLRTSIAQRLADAPPCPLLVVPQLIAQASSGA